MINIAFLGRPLLGKFLDGHWTGKINAVHFVGLVVSENVAVK